MHRCTRCHHTKRSGSFRATTKGHGWVDEEGQNRESICCPCRRESDASRERNHRPVFASNATRTLADVAENGFDDRPRPAPRLDGSAFLHLFSAMGLREDEPL